MMHRCCRPWPSWERWPSLAWAPPGRAFPVLPGRRAGHHGSARGFLRGAAAPAVAPLTLAAVATRRGKVAAYGAALGAMHLRFCLSLRTLMFGMSVASEFCGPLAVALPCPAARWTSPGWGWRPRACAVAAGPGHARSARRALPTPVRRCLHP